MLATLLSLVGFDRPRSRRSKPACPKLRQLRAERLEDRCLLNSRPVAMPDPFHETALNTQVQVSGILTNDFDADIADQLTAVLVGSQDIAVTNFTTGGSFTGTPTSGFVGQAFVFYKVNDGTSDSNVTTVVIAVSGNFGGRTNLEENPRDGPTLMAGDLRFTQPLVLGQELVYSSLTLPKPIIVVETFLQASSSVPDEVLAKLTFNGTAGTTYSYSVSGLTAGAPLRFAIQADATSLATGRYVWTLQLTARFGSNNYTRDYTGFALLVNRSASEFGKGFWLVGLDKIVSGTGGVQLVECEGTSLWFADNGSGGYLPAEGDLTFSTLVKNGDNSWTRTTADGFKTNYNTSGLRVSRVDANGLTWTYTYTSGLLTGIADPFSRSVSLSYSSGLLSSITDIASKSASLSYSSGKLSSVTQPDPDGGGSLTAPVTSFAYDGSTSLLTSVTLPDPDGAGSLTSPVITYTHTNHRLATISHSGGGSITLTPMQRVGLPTGTSGNSLTAPSAAKTTLVDPRNKTWEYKFDRFGNAVSIKDPLANTTTIERNHVGQPFRLTGSDPDGGGSQTAPVTKFGYNTSGDHIRTYQPDGSSRSMTYNTSHRRLLTDTDEVGRVWTFTYDSYGNRLTAVDPGSNTWTWVYNSSGNPTSLTTPDPDGAGGQSAYVTTFSYDSYQRPITITFPDSSDRELTWDSADNLLTDKNKLNQSGTWVYDALNRVTKYTDRVGAEWEFSFDALSRHIKTLDPFDKATDYEYSARSFLTKEIQPDPDGAGSLPRPEITYAYDSAGNLTQVGLPSYYNGAALTYTYNDAGWRITESGPVTLRTETLTYDNLARVTKVTTPDPDGAGQLTNKNTTYEYNSRGWVTKLLRDDPNLTGPLTAPYQTFTYNAAGDLTSATDFRGYTTSVQYLSRGLVSDIIEPDPDGSGPGSPPVTTFGYDALGRRTHLTDPILLPVWGMTVANIRSPIWRDHFFTVVGTALRDRQREMSPQEIEDADWDKIVMDVTSQAILGGLDPEFADTPIGDLAARWDRFRVPIITSILIPALAFEDTLRDLVWHLRINYPGLAHRIPDHITIDPVIMRLHMGRTTLAVRPIVQAPLPWKLPGATPLIFGMGATAQGPRLEGDITITNADEGSLQVGGQAIFKF